MNTQNTLLALLLTLWVGLAGTLNAQQVPAASATKDYLQLSRELLNKYYETQKILSREQADWKTGRELLQSRVDLMKAQLKELQTKTEEENKTISTSDTEREKLDAQNKELLKTQDLQVESIEKIEARVRKLWPLLPQFLQGKISGQYDRLPKPGMKREDIKLSVGERFVNVLLVLGEVNKFHGDITVLNERRKVAGGRELEVRVIYFGLAAAYFAGSGETADVGGMLLPGPEGWEAVEDPKMAPLINDVISMNKSEKIAGFVSLPVKVR